MTKFNAVVSILWLAVSLYGQPARSTKPELESAAVSIPPLRCRAERPRNSYTGHIRLAQCFGHGRLTPLTGAVSPGVTSLEPYVSFATGLALDSKGKFIYTPRPGPYGCGQIAVYND